MQEDVLDHRVSCGVCFTTSLLDNLILLEFVSSGTARLPYRVPSEPFAAFLQVLQTTIILQGYQVFDFKREKKHTTRTILSI